MASNKVMEFTLVPANWSNNQYVINSAEAIVTNHFYLCTPHPDDVEKYVSANIKLNEVTQPGIFLLTCDTTPLENIKIRISRIFESVSDEQEMEDMIGGYY